jgi:hypothetical protein
VTVKGLSDSPQRLSRGKNFGFRYHSRKQRHGTVAGAPGGLQPMRPLFRRAHQKRFLMGRIADQIHALVCLQFVDQDLNVLPGSASQPRNLGHGLVPMQF